MSSRLNIFFTLISPNTRTESTHSTLPPLPNTEIELTGSFEMKPSHYIPAGSRIKYTTNFTHRIISLVFIVMMEKLCVNNVKIPGSGHLQRRGRSWTHPLIWIQELATQHRAPDIWLRPPMFFSLCLPHSYIA